jgi:hypothetical protein
MSIGGRLGCQGVGDGAPVSLQPSVAWIEMNDNCSSATCGDGASEDLHEKELLESHSNRPRSWRPRNWLLGVDSGELQRACKNRLSADTSHL